MNPQTTFKPGAQPARRFTLRTWATPVTIGSFVLMAVSGVLMFFDIVPGYLSFAHEWFSWLFVAGVAGHVAVNWRPLTRHLQTGWGRASVGLLAAVLLVSTFSFGRITAPQLKWPIVEALVEAPLSTLADLTRREPAAVVERLRIHGIVATPEQSIAQLAEAHGEDVFHVLGLVILRK